jgi:SHAQKYF class myb-like DNA-binding protein
MTTEPRRKVVPTNVDVVTNTQIDADPGPAPVRSGFVTSIPPALSPAYATQVPAPAQVPRTQFPAPMRQAQVPALTSVPQTQILIPAPVTQSLAPAPQEQARTAVLVPLAQGPVPSSMLQVEGRAPAPKSQIAAPAAVSLRQVPAPAPVPRNQVLQASLSQTRSPKPQLASPPVGATKTPSVAALNPVHNGLPASQPPSASNNAASAPAQTYAAPPPSHPAAPAPLTSSAPTNGASSGGSNRKSSKSKRKPAAAVTMATAATATSTGSTAGENTGRWTAEEHRLFLQGLDQHGKGWKKIASLIKSRTVVQIRTHAQKYFQKLSKARQNGEVPDAEHHRHMNIDGHGLGGMVLSSNHTSVGASVSSDQHPPVAKKRKQLSGTKRKSISSVVNSVAAERRGQKQAPHAKPGAAEPKPTVNTAIAPALVHYIVPVASAPSNTPYPQCQAPHLAVDYTKEQLEESLYRFLTPSVIENLAPPPLAPPGAVNSASASTTEITSSVDPIKVPGSTTFSDPFAGEISPTGVNDVAFPLIPGWFSKGADVEELLDEADALDWLADSGDLDETYSHILSSKTPNFSSNVPSLCATSDAGSEATSTVVGNAAPPGVSDARICNHATAVQAPPTLGQQPFEEQHFKRQKFASATEAMEATLPSVPSAAQIVGTTGGAEEFAVFDSAFDEQAFVSALLDSGEATAALPTLN